MKIFSNVLGLGFNPKNPTKMHIDLNSCFATVEQQANPNLRGKPVAVAAYDSPGGCIIAPSVEAKSMGIKVGMRVFEGRGICSELVVREPDPWKYRNVHLRLRKIISQYTNDFVAKSIDEFVLDLEGYPLFDRGLDFVARQIKNRIKKEIGEWIRVSVGIGPNRFLAKLASGLKKPDGLEVISVENYKKVYEKLSLMDLCGIKFRNSARLNSIGIFSVLDFYNTSWMDLKSCFESISGYYWYLRLRGWEIDDFEFGRKSYGNSYAFQKPYSKLSDIAPILSKLVTKMSFRMRRAGYRARGVYLAISYKSGNFWHKRITCKREIFETSEIYKVAYAILCMSPHKGPVRDMSVSCFGLIKNDKFQLDLFGDVEKRGQVCRSVDEVNERWGEFVIIPARMIRTENEVVDRIAFGGVKELEEFTLS